MYTIFNLNVSREEHHHQSGWFVWKIKYLLSKGRPSLAVCFYLELQQQQEQQQQQHEEEEEATPVRTDWNPSVGAREIALENWDKECVLSSCCWFLKLLELPSDVVRVDCVAAKRIIMHRARAKPRKKQRQRQRQKQRQTYDAGKKGRERKGGEEGGETDDSKETTDEDEDKGTLNEENEEVNEEANRRGNNTQQKKEQQEEQQERKEDQESHKVESQPPFLLLRVLLACHEKQSKKTIYIYICPYVI